MNYPEPPASIALGCQILMENQIQLRLWAPGAEAVRVVCWQDSWTKTSLAQPDLDLVCRSEDFCACWVADIHPSRHGIQLPFYYQFVIERSGQSQAIFDPWAKAADLSDGRQSPRACAMDVDALRQEKQPVADGGWYRHPAQAIIYEAHVRDLTMNQRSPIPAGLRGTYIGAVGALDRIGSLGVTHLQLLPLQIFGRTHEGNQAYENAADTRTHNYNWGYDPLGYFVPSAWYARVPADPASRVRDLGILVGEAHARGLRVIIDVVYNHQYHTADLEMMAPGYWFRRGHNGELLSNSGCGNDLESLRPMFRRLMVESLCHWVRHYDVDGFRFDLMGLIDSETMTMAIAACQALKPDLLFLGEGWQMYNGPAGSHGMDQKAVAEARDLAVFNDEYRDLLKGGGMNEALRGFLHGHMVHRQLLESNLRGQPKERYRTKFPWQNVQYLECHDGLTLHDNLAYNLELDPADPDHHQQILRRCALGNFLLALTQGICFLHAGQEFGRTKHLPHRSQGHEGLDGFVRNSYRSGDLVNALPWQLSPNQDWLLVWTKGLLELRRSHHLLRFETQTSDDRRWTFFTQGAKSLLAWTIAAGSTTLLCACNATNQPHDLRLPLSLRESLAAAAENGRLKCLVDANGCQKEGIAVPSGLSLAPSGLRLEGLSAFLLEIET